MNVQSFNNAHNRGTFHLEDTVFKSGDTNPDRQSSDPYIPYQESDSLAFQSAPTKDQNRPSFIQRLYYLDTRIITAFIVGVITIMFVHALSDRWPMLTISMGILTAVMTYILSFFNLDRVLQRLNQQRPVSYHHYTQSPGTYSPPHYPIYRHTGPLSP